MLSPESLDNLVEKKLRGNANNAELISLYSWNELNQ